MVKNALSKCRNCGSPSLRVWVYARFTSLTWFNFIKYHVILLLLFLLWSLHNNALCGVYLVAIVDNRTICVCVLCTCFNLQAVLKIYRCKHLQSLWNAWLPIFDSLCWFLTNDSQMDFYSTNVTKIVANLKRHMFRFLCFIQFASVFFKHGVWIQDT